MFKNCCGCQCKKTNRKESEDDEDEEETKEEKETDNQINNAIEKTNESTAGEFAQKEVVEEKLAESEMKEERKKVSPEQEPLPEIVQRKTSLKKPKPRLSISTEVRIIPSNFPEDLEDLPGDEDEEPPPETTKKEDEEEDEEPEEKIKITIKNIDGKVIKKSLTDDSPGKLSPPASEADRPTSPLSDEVFVTSEQGGLELPLHNLGVKVDVIEKQALACGLDIPLSPRGQAPTPHPVKRSSMPAVLPRWLSEDDDDEKGGTHEPPATPVARDELALRRHRFFSDLLSAAQAATEHRVRFDPFGPTIERRQSTLSMSVQGYQDILQGPFASYLEISARIGGDVAEHAKLVQQAFQAQLQYLSIASTSSKPNQSDEMRLLQPTSQYIQAIQDYREKHRSSQYFNHLSAISESIPALGWVTISPAPSPYVKEMNDAGQFYTNRVLKDWKEKDKVHVDWTKAWVQTLTELQSFVKQFHTTGIVWSGTSAPRVTGVPPPPPPCGMPPPPPVLDLGDIAPADSGQDRSALFAEINQGENITRSLKKVTDDMQTHKNPGLRSGPAPFKAPPASITNQTPKPFKAASPPEKPPKFTRDGKKWLIEYQKGNHQLVVDNAEMNNVIYVFKCTDSTLVVKGKVNSIFLDSCKKTAVVFDSVVSSIEFVNCQSVQMQVLGKVPTISIDKTDGCQMYLSQDSLGVEVISSKSSEMNVLVPVGNGDFAEHPVPEQFKTTVSSKGLSTIAVESKG